MFPSTCNTRHALPLTFVRFSCCARRRAQLRRCIAIRDSRAAIGSSSNANRTCERSRQQGGFNFAAQCCVSAARYAASANSSPLPRL
jgi:hypothetical protein